MSFFKFISQKIKDLYHFIKELFYNKKILLEQQNQNKLPEKQTAEYPVKVPIGCDNIELSIKYVLGLLNTPGFNAGVGIIIDDVDDLRGLNTVMNLVCREFKYVTIYTKNISAGNKTADYVYSKFGLPIMVLDVSESQKCRYQVIIDFNNGKLRCGRDLCVTGTAKDKNGDTVGLYLGERLVTV